MSNVKDVITAIMKVVGDIPGIKGAPVEIPEKPGAYPFAAAYEGPGTWTITTPGGISPVVGSAMGLHDIIVAIHIERKQHPYDVRSAMSYSDVVPKALMKSFITTKWDNSADAYSGEIATSGLVKMEYGGVETIGFEFTIKQCKIISDIT